MKIIACALSMAGILAGAPGEAIVDGHLEAPANDVDDHHLGN